MPYHGDQAAIIEIRVGNFMRLAVTVVKIMSDAAIDNIIFAENCVQKAGFAGTAVARNGPVLTGADLPGKVPEKGFVEIAHGNVLQAQKWEYIAHSVQKWFPAPISATS